MRPLVLVLLPLGLWAPVPEPEEPAPGADLQGKWVCVSRHIDGGKEDPNRHGEITMRVEKDMLIFRFGDREVLHKIRLDVKQSPKWFDLLPQDPRFKGRACLGIYKFDGDILVHAVNVRGTDERPKDFSTPAFNSGLDVSYYRKAK